MRPLKENYLIKLTGTQEGDGVKDNISLCTKGEFSCRRNIFYITYKESETTGYKGCTTTVKAEGNRKVSMLRFGPTPSQMVLESGVRHICHYETGAGAFSLGLSADEILCDLNEDGGRLYFSYLLDVGSETISKNTIDITVRKELS